MKITVYVALFKELYYNYTDKKTMYNGWMFQTHFLPNINYYTLEHEAAHHTAQNVSLSTKQKRARLMENQEHIYSDLHEFNPPLWSHKDSQSFCPALELLTKPNEGIVITVVTST